MDDLGNHDPAGAVNPANPANPANGVTDTSRRLWFGPAAAGAGADSDSDSDTDATEECTTPPPSPPPSPSDYVEPITVHAWDPRDDNMPPTDKINRTRRVT